MRRVEGEAQGRDLKLRVGRLVAYLRVRDGDLLQVQKRRSLDGRGEVRRSEREDEDPLVLWLLGAYLGIHPLELV